MIDEEHGWKSLIKALLNSFSHVFTSAILSLVVVLILVIRFVPDMYLEQFPFFITFDMAGLSLNAILQFAGVSITMALVITLLFSGHFFPKMRYAHRLFLLSLTSSSVIFIFSIIFRWFPFDTSFAWFPFAVCIVTCGGLTFLFSWLGHKLEGKKYDKLLANYKEQRKKEV